MHNQYTTGAAAGQAPGFELDSNGRWTRKKTFDELPLCDRSSSGKVRPWRTRKLQALSLADIYEGLALQACPEDSPAAAAASSMAAAIDAELGLSTTPDGIQYNAATGEIIEHSVERKLPTAAAKYLDKAERLARCAAWAEFERLPEGQGLRLHDASFCRVRLCPMCQWRRSLKLGAQVRRVVERANADHLAETGAPWRWLMVTFTVQNVPGPQLGAEIDRLHKAVNNLAKCARWRAAVRGWLRATEVTHNTDKKSRSYDTYHPHLHMLLCVPAGYFSGKGYIRQKEWADLWAHYARTDYTPIVDVRTIKAEDGRSVQDLPAAEQAAAMGKACAEVSKYAAKPGDYIIAADPQLSMRTVALLDSMLDKRRMTSWGGVLKDIAKALLPDRRVGLMHGKLKPKEKAAVMEDFKTGRLDALVSTTVIEVGVDVPNASVMVIENAERYGLSALHQLRGRVGRGAAESWCFLVSDNTGEAVQKRLKFLCSTTDGFAVAQYDLETRGPGDFFGSRQHGLPTLQIADLMNDTRTLHAAQSEALAMLAEDPLLQAPEHALLAAQVQQMFDKAGPMN